MGLRSYILAMIIGTIISTTAFILAVIFINPETANIVSITLFYVSLFLSILGVFAILGILFRIIIFKHELAIQKAKISLRQSFWLASLVTIALILQSFRLLTWWNIFLLLGAFLLFEFLFLTDDQNFPQPRKTKGETGEDHTKM